MHLFWTPIAPFSRISVTIARDARNQDVSTTADNDENHPLVG